MPKPMGKRKTKKTYLGSGAGSLRSGTGATAKKPKKSKFSIPTRVDFFPSRPKPEGRKIRTFPIPKKEFRPITPKSPATGVGSVFGSSFTEAKKRRKTTRTMRRRAKR